MLSSLLLSLSRLEGGGGGGPARGLGGGGALRFIGFDPPTPSDSILCY